MENRKDSSVALVWAYVVGTFLVLLLAVIATWADLESSFYGFDRRGSAPVKGLSCPVLMSKNETAVVSLKIKNTAERTLSPSVRAEFSTRITPESDLRSIKLSPGETRRLQWTINSENIDLGRFVFSKVLIYAFYPIPDSEGTCGTFVVNLPIPGNVLLALWILIGMAGMYGGLYGIQRLIPKSERVVHALRPTLFLAVLCTVLLVASLLGWWVQAVLLLAVTLLTIIITLSTVFMR